MENYRKYLLHAIQSAKKLSATSTIEENRNHAEGKLFAFQCALKAFDECLKQENAENLLAAMENGINLIPKMGLYK